MKLLRYLKEENDVKFDIISKNCKKILDLYKKTGIYLYRGIKKNYNDLTLIKVRKNRKPRDTPLFMHKNIDEYFFKKFGYKARSTSIFATSNKNTAADYGKEYIIFPVGDDWTTIWSPEVNDLFTETDQLDITDIDDIDDILNTYQFGHEEQALMSGNEVMIVNCDEYYVINTTLESLDKFLVLLSIDNKYLKKKLNDGIWNGGTWLNGTWNGGTWLNGIWYDGTWNNGTWNDGTWHGGTWLNGTWKDGTWNGGAWLDGTWEAGAWWYGTWKSGTWKDGTWKDGIWKDGIWYDGTWKNGEWKKGKILNPITKKFEESDVNPTEFYKKIGYKK